MVCARCKIRKTGEDFGEQVFLEAEVFEGVEESDGRNFHAASLFCMAGCGMSWAGRYILLDWPLHICCYTQ